MIVAQTASRQTHRIQIIEKLINHHTNVCNKNDAIQRSGDRPIQMV